MELTNAVRIGGDVAKTFFGEGGPIARIEAVVPRVEVRLAGQATRFGDPPSITDLAHDAAVGRDLLIQRLGELPASVVPAGYYLG
jgi:hypothetical protein